MVAKKSESSLIPKWPKCKKRLILRKLGYFEVPDYEIILKNQNCESIQIKIWIKFK